ncbi:MAG: SRPBCC domain-containing protein [Vicinamibacterales bacterium]
MADVSDFVEREIRIAARPEVVFQYFVDPVKMIEWKGVDAALDARPGGVYRVNVTGREIAVGEYVEVVPYERIVFTWGWEPGHDIPPGSTTVEVTLTPDGDGTILRLRHSGLTGEAIMQHTVGWDHFLPRLAEAASGGNPGPDPWAVQPSEQDGHQ